MSKQKTPITPNNSIDKNLSDLSENMEDIEEVQEPKNETKTILKPKKNMTKAQKENLEKGRLARQEKLIQKIKDKEEEQKRKQLVELAKAKKEEHQRKQDEKLINKYLKDNGTNTDTDINESSEDEIVIVKKKSQKKSKEVNKTALPIDDTPYTKLKHKKLNQIEKSVPDKSTPIKDDLSNFIYQPNKFYIR
jgi:hypothetical protein